VTGQRFLATLKPSGDLQELKSLLESKYHGKVIAEYEYSIFKGVLFETVPGVAAKSMQAWEDELSGFEGFKRIEEDREVHIA